MKSIILILVAASSLLAQTYTVEKISGNAMLQENGNEEWISLNSGDKIYENAIISTDQKSELQFGNGELSFNLSEFSAISISSIKKMSVDELLLALALEDMLDAPKNIEKSSDNTAVYGTKESTVSSLHVKSNDFGIKRLNGAVKLAELGFEESSVVAARETFRKYPATKSLAAYRLFFADILFNKGLYEEALQEYSDIKNLNINENQKIELNSKLELIGKKLLSN